MAAWTPTDLPGVLLWLDAASPSTMTLDGSSVVSWASRVGDIVVSSPAGSRPTWQANGRNGLPCVRIEPGRHLFSDNVATLPVGTDPSTMACVAWLDAGGQAYASILSYGASSDFQERSLFSNGGSRTVGFSSYASDYTTGLTWAQDRIVVAEVVGDWDVREWVDGTRFDFAARVATAVGGRLSVGKHATAGDYWRGVAQELLIFDGVPTEADRLRLEGYLAHRWGRTASLPADHPYRYVPPQAGAPMFVRQGGVWRMARRAFVRSGDVWIPAGSVAVRDAEWKGVDIG